MFQSASSFTTPVVSRLQPSASRNIKSPPPPHSIIVKLFAMEHSKFHPFPRLPKELRLQIWEIAQSSVLPQVITVDYLQAVPMGLRLRYPRLKAFPQACCDYQHLAVPTHPVPPLLQACKESRTASLPSYRKGFEYTCVHPEHQKNSGDLYLSREGRQCLEKCLKSRTRCQHEVANQGKVWWDPDKDVVLASNFRGVSSHEDFLNSVSQVFWLGEIPDQVCEMKIDGVKNLAVDPYYFCDLQLCWWQNEWIIDELPFFRGMKRVFLLFNEELLDDDTRNSYSTAEGMKQELLAKFSTRLTPETAAPETWPEVHIVNDTECVVSLLRK
jgi:hypothetical protein